MQLSLRTLVSRAFDERSAPGNIGRRWCNSMNRREGCFHGKRAASRNGSNLSKCNSWQTDREVERLIEAAKQNRCGHRDATAILVAYRHGLRASELVTLRWDDIDLATGRLHVRRAKSGDASVHPIAARESRALRKLLREAATSPYVFISERRAPLSVAGYQRMVARVGVAAKFTSSCIPTCCGMPAGSSSPTTATTLVPSKPISATDRSCPRSATRH